MNIDRQIKQWAQLVRESMDESLVPQNGTTPQGEIDEGYIDKIKKFFSKDKPNEQKDEKLTVGKLIQLYKGETKGTIRVNTVNDGVSDSKHFIENIGNIDYIGIKDDGMVHLSYIDNHDRGDRIDPIEGMEKDLKSKKINADAIIALNDEPLYFRGQSVKESADGNDAQELQQKIKTLDSLVDKAVKSGRLKGHEDIAQDLKNLDKNLQESINEGSNDNSPSWGNIVGIAAVVSIVDTLIDLLTDAVL